MGTMTARANAYESWLTDVKEALDSLNMNMDDWQRVWGFNFADEYKAGTAAAEAARKANQFWWHQQNKAIGQDCQKTPNCWLPRHHAGNCEPR